MDFKIPYTNNPCNSCEHMFSCYNHLACSKYKRYDAYRKQFKSDTKPNGYKTNTRELKRKK